MPVWAEKSCTLYEFGARNVILAPPGQFDHQAADEFDIQRNAVGPGLVVDDAVCVQKARSVVDLGADDHVFLFSHFRPPPSPD
jgi:hypothetical protein